MGPDRRGFLLSASAIGAAALVAGGAGQVLRRRYEVAGVRRELVLPAAGDAQAAPAGADLGIRDLSPFITPNDEFYRIDTALLVPQVSPDRWRLRVHGLVDREIEIGFADLLRRPLIERDVTLSCVSNEVGGGLVGNAVWRGARLADLLDEAGVQPSATQLLSTSVDGWTCGTPVSAVMDGRDALLAVAMNGEPLPVSHGFPVRMVVPGLYGYVSATKWVVDLKLTTWEDDVAYWVPRGWAREAPVKTMSRIDVPRQRRRSRPGRWRRRGRMGAAPGHQRRRGAGGRRPVAPGPPGRGPERGQLGAVGGRMGRRPGRPRGDRARLRRRGGPPAQGAAPPAPDGAQGWHRRDFRSRRPEELRLASRARTRNLGETASWAGPGVSSTVGAAERRQIQREPGRPAGRREGVGPFPARSRWMLRADGASVAQMAGARRAEPCPGHLREPQPGCA